KVFGIYVIHFSLQSNHIHMIIEAKSGANLAAGMKSLSGRLGKAIRKVTGGVGAVFKGRFHMHILKSPTEMKRALEYVLLNTAKHWKFVDHVDDFSSGRAFKEWRKLLGRRFRGLIEDQLENSQLKHEELSPPRSWLCREGWMRAA
ncbi:MAG: transposase, partial [Bdellovibrionales bacterium]